MNSSLGQGQITGFKNIEVPTRHGDICVCRNGVIDRHAKGTEVRSQHEVVHETAVTIVYLKLVRDGKKQVVERTPTDDSTKLVSSHTSANRL
jgi:hypothetical protein